MKKKLLLLSALGMLLTQNISAQAFSLESSYLNAGYGVGNLTQSFFKVGEINDYQYKYSGVGPFFLKYEYAVAEKMGVGINIAYAQAQATYGYTNTFITDGSRLLKETLDWKSYSVLLRFNMHFGENEKVDPYWGIGAGYRSATWSGFNNDPQVTYDEAKFNNPLNIGFETTFGCRFLFTENVGAYVEVGFAKAVLQFGLTAKF
jgi:opacity protein-like surface antigen